MHPLGDVLNALGRFFSSAWKTLGEYLHIAIPEATAAVLNDLLQVADPIIQDLQSTSLTGEEKRQQAIALIQGKAIQAGWDVGVSLIHAAIELAVLKNKATQPTSPVADGGVLKGGETGPTPEPIA